MSVSALARIHRSEWWGNCNGTWQGWRGIAQSDFGWIGPVVGPLSAKGAGHGVSGISKELSLAQVCGASWRGL